VYFQKNTKKRLNLLPCFIVVYSQTRKALTRGHTDHLRLVLLIYSFRFRSAFPPRCRNWFSQFHKFTLSHSA